MWVFQVSICSNHRSLPFLGNMPVLEMTVKYVLKAGCFD